MDPPLVVKGETILSDHVSKNTSGVATAADSTPTVTMYADADYQAQSNGISMTVSAVTGVTGAYAATKDSTGLALGSYVIKWTYAISASNRLFTYRVRIA